MNNVKTLLSKPFSGDSRKVGGTSPSASHDEENPFESDVNPIAEPVAAPAKKKKKKAVDASAVSVSVSDGDPLVPTASTSTGKKVKNQQYSYVDPESDEKEREREARAKDLAILEANLKAREAKMAEKEREVEKRELQVKGKEGQAHNWPFKFYAITYHSIPDDIPAPNQKLCSDFYLMIRFFWFVLLWNFITILTCLIQGSGTIIDFLFSIFYLVVGVVGSWQLWYKSLYYSLKSKAALKWMAFYISFGLHWLFVVAGFVGYIAAGGILQLLSALSSGSAASILFCVVCTILWGIELLVSTWLFKRARSVGKESGGDTKSMQSGMASQAIKMQVGL